MQTWLGRGSKSSVESRRVRDRDGFVALPLAVSSRPRLHLASKLESSQLEQGELDRINCHKSTRTRRRTSHKLVPRANKMRRAGESVFAEVGSEPVLEGYSVLIAVAFKRP